MRRSIPKLLALFAASLTLALSALAAPSVRVAPGRGGIYLTVGGELITIFREANDGVTPERRAEIAARRIRGLIDAGLRARDIEPRPYQDGWAVFGRGGLLMIATPEEAKARNEEPEETARRWAVNLKKALGDRPDLQAKKSAKAVRTAKAGKAAKPTAKAAPKPAPVKTAAKPAPKPAAPRVASAKPAAKPAPDRPASERPAEVKPAPPKTAVKPALKPEPEPVASDPGEEVPEPAPAPKPAVARASANGKKAAGRVIPPDPAEVTGTIAPAEFVKKVAVARAMDAVQREPGATVRFTGESQGIKALARGQSTQVTLPITISGEPYQTVKTAVRVRVDNIDLPSEEARTLLYSNDPESFRECRPLFQGIVDEAAPARLLFHHQNRTGRTCVFQVHLLNPNPRPVEVQVIGGDAGPFVDPIQVGHRAAERYLAASVKEIGYIIRIPAGGSRVVSSMKMPAEDTISGIYDLRVMEGGDLVAHVAAQPQLAAPSVSTDLLNVARSEPHTYSVTRKDEEYQYSVGGRWCFMPLGRKAIKSRNEDRTLYGNYGVVYNFTVDVDNPTNEAQTIKVMMSPDAGWARGVFLVEGRVVEVPQIAPPIEATVWSFRLEPGERRRVTIQGIPVGGSNYPISLVVRS